VFYFRCGRLGNISPARRIGADAAQGLYKMQSFQMIKVQVNWLEQEPPEQLTELMVDFLQQVE
jgi:hypothetical protein